MRSLGVAAMAALENMRSCIVDVREAEIARARARMEELAARIEMLRMSGSNSVALDRVQRDLAEVQAEVDDMEAKLAELKAMELL